MPLKVGQSKFKFPKSGCYKCKLSKSLPIFQRGTRFWVYLQEAVVFERDEKKKVLDWVKSIFLPLESLDVLTNEGTCFPITVPRHRESHVPRPPLGQDRKKLQQTKYKYAHWNQRALNTKRVDLWLKRDLPSNSRVGEKAVRGMGCEGIGTWLLTVLWVIGGLLSTTFLMPETVKNPEMAKLKTQIEE